MAERLDHFDFEADPPRKVSPYPLDLWMDGSIWRIWEGEDFDGPVRTMRNRLHYYATSSRLSVRTRMVRDGDRTGLVFRFAARDFTHELR